MSDEIRITSKETSTDAVRIGRVMLYFSYQTLVGFDCPHLGTVRTPTKYGTTTAKHMNGFGLKDARTTATEADFQTLALRAVQAHTRDIGGLLLGEGE